MNTGNEVFSVTVSSQAAGRWITLIGLLLCANVAQAKPGDSRLFSFDPAPSAAETRQQLAYGYAMLYEATRQLGHIDKALWLKREDASVRRVIRDLASTMKSLATSLEALAEKPPTIDLKDNGLPVYEVKKRNSVYLERGLDVGTPLAGRTGADFERVLLLSMSAAVNQQRHLARVMIGDESIEARKQWLTRAEARFDERYQDMIELLESAYFCDPKR